MSSETSPSTASLQSRYHLPGVHLILDCHGCSHLDDAAYIERALLDAAEAVGATVLHSFTHSFGDGEGVTGVVALSESHISVHTWPEVGYAAFDIFVCGAVTPDAAAGIIRKRFEPDGINTKRIDRGIPVF